MAQRRNLRTFAWFVLAYTLGVILFGAWVRITGSGAGCGQDWPTCHGEVVPRTESIQTLIEYTHRLTSSADGLLVIALLVWVLRAVPKPAVARWGAWLSLLFVITEGLVGAFLVKAELVVDDDSVMRAIVMSVHLVNPSLLTGAMALVAVGTDGRRLQLRGQGRVAWMLAAGLVALLLVKMTGAVTALGDTLYPVGEHASKLEVLRNDHAVSAHFLQRMRVLHPMASVAVAMYLVYMCLGVKDRRPTPEVARWSTVSLTLVISQVLLGVANIALSAPGWMQVVHLGVATALWVALVLLGAAALSRGEADGTAP